MSLNLDLMSSPTSALSFDVLKSCSGVEFLGSLSFASTSLGFALVPFSALQSSRFALMPSSSTLVLLSFDVMPSRFQQ